MAKPFLLVLWSEISFLKECENTDIERKERYKLFRSWNQKLEFREKHNMDVCNCR